MKRIEEILQLPPAVAVKELTKKNVKIRPWEELEKEYDPKKHPVMNTAEYPDVVQADGTVERVSRVPIDYQRLASKRMAELVAGTPIKRVYKPESQRQKEAGAMIEAIYDRNRIDAVNTERIGMLFSGCEVFTLWYAVEEPNTYYGTKSNLKLRCRNYSPILGHGLYPLFDETGDLIAMSIKTTTKEEERITERLDTYTEERHIVFTKRTEEDWTVTATEVHNIGKIPGVYCYRQTPVWEDTSSIVYEIEWALSRNGNYLRRNSKPVFYISTAEGIDYGQERDEKSEFRTILQVPQGASLGYVTWNQATDTLKLYIDELRKLFFTQLQIPDWSYEDMKNNAMSGEARKQLFIDAHLKVRDESGRLLELFDREMNVVKAFLKVILHDGYREDIDALRVDNIITPYILDDEATTVRTLIEANGNKPLISHRESIERYGYSDDADKTLQEIAEETNVQDLFG